ncbi:MAG: bifunctional phosphoribosylaminoimidazolecarboxamide formyltransferase/IMP cyclohydrolase [Alphaproteobacteria bacterium]|nr:bifunctional phosphoribosylaminoimidazolecarboxamide formyltransferase/IMP cyclohydrolase [Alphaproteobacteria bacterium]
MNLPIKRALISLSDKTGLIEFAQNLHDLGVELLSTGGTSKAIADAGIPVIDVADITKFPEMMDGRVKTLHPAVHGGLLALRDNDDHIKAQQEHNIPNIDLLVVNLYPFEETVTKGGDYEDCVENIDIGGPAMIRAASKNHGFVTTIVETADYQTVLDEMAANNGATTLATRKKLAAKAYARTAAYDAAISNWFAEQLNTPTPDYRAFGGNLKQTLRYGENPHQTAAFYVNGDNRKGVATATQLQGKELSFNNINDTDAAFELVAEFNPSQTKAVAIIKHANPCGVATGNDLVATYKAALKCDPVSAFGGIVAMNDTITADLATEIVKVFTEVIIAPAATDEAKTIIAAKKNLRLLVTGGLPDAKSEGLNIRSVAGGMLVQSRDNGCVDDLDLKTVTKRAPSAQEMADMKLAFKICKHVKSNAIIYVKDGATVGIGAGQMSRIDSTRVAAQKAEDAAETAGETASLVKGSVVASDAFFPFADGLIAAAAAGATAIIQPGGSMRDDEVIAAADEAGLAMVFTGMRHFKH